VTLSNLVDKSQCSEGTCWHYRRQQDHIPGHRNLDTGHCGHQNCYINLPTSHMFLTWLLRYYNAWTQSRALVSFTKNAIALQKLAAKYNYN
jgi:hypothetical protein